MSKFVVYALYKFATLDDFEDLKEPLLNCMKNNGVRGSLLLASEGVNGTISGTREGIDAVLEHLRKDERLKDLEGKESFADELPFERSKVLLKKEIVTMGVPGTDPTKIVGTYVKPKDWNELISDPDTIVIDTRNDYETAIGTFKNAIDPNTETFRDFPQYVHDEMDDIDRDKKVAMFCTGGIRCEKSTAFMKEQGFKNVYHLEGGILKYLEEVPKEESLWEGECFVFDNRVAVKHGLEQGKYDQCYACRMPITEEDKERPEYEKGISCHHCYGKKTEAQKAAYAERQKQVELAKERKQKHVGDVSETMLNNRKAKDELKEKTRGPLASTKN